MNIKIGRNDKCPCGSGKKYKKCCIQNEDRNISGFHQDHNGIHAILPGDLPSEEMVEKATIKYQENIKNSPMWDEIVEKYGKEKAEELLKECKVKVQK